MLSTLYENPLPTVYDAAERELPGNLAPATFGAELAGRVMEGRRREWMEHTKRVFGSEVAEKLLEEAQFGESGKGWTKVCGWRVGGGGGRLSRRSKMVDT